MNRINTLLLLIVLVHWATAIFAQPTRMQNADPDRTATRPSSPLISPELPIASFLIERNLLMTFTLPGYQSLKVVAQVNNDTIKEEDFINRALRVTSIAPQSGLDAGGITLVTMIKEDLIQQLAKSKGITVTDDQVARYIAITEKLEPPLLESIKSGKVQAEDVNREYKMEMLLFALGTDNAQVDQKELQAAYNKHKPELTIPGSYKIRILPLQDMAKAKLALEELKKSGDFKKAATVAGIPAQVAANVGQEVPLPKAQTPPALVAVFDKMTPMSFTPKPVSVEIQTGKFYIVAQLISKTDDHVLTLDEARPRVERLALTDKFPQWGQHADTAINNFITASKDNIQINIDRYKPLKDQFIMPKPKP